MRPIPLHRKETDVILFVGCMSFKGNRSFLTYMEILLQSIIILVRSAESVLRLKFTARKDTQSTVRVTVPRSEE